MTTRVISRTQISNQPAFLKLTDGDPLMQRLIRPTTPYPAAPTKYSRAGAIRTATVWKTGFAQNPNY